jgi:hypothetical protein
VRLILPWGIRSRGILPGGSLVRWPWGYTHPGGPGSTGYNYYNYLSYNYYNYYNYLSYNYYNYYNYLRFMTLGAQGAPD